MQGHVAGKQGVAAMNGFSSERVVLKHRPITVFHDVLLSRNVAYSSWTKETQSSLSGDGVKTLYPGAPRWKRQQVDHRLEKKSSNCPI